MNYEVSEVTKLQIVCGPYRDDFKTQKFILKKRGSSEFHGDLLNEKLLLYSSIIVEVK